MRLFYFSYKQVKHDFSLRRAYAIICGRFNITVNWDYLHAQNQGKLASVCLHRFSSIFESTISSMYIELNSKIVSEYDQEIPQSQTADNPMAPRGRAASQSLWLKVHGTRFILTFEFSATWISRKCSKIFIFLFLGAQWLSDRVLDSRPRGCRFKPHQYHCAVSLHMAH